MCPFLEYEVPDHIGAEIFAQLVQFVIEELMPLDEEKAYDILKSAEISESTIRNLMY